MIPVSIFSVVKVGYGCDANWSFAKTIVINQIGNKGLDLESRIINKRIGKKDK